MRIPFLCRPEELIVTFSKGDLWLTQETLTVLWCLRFDVNIAGELAINTETEGVWYFVCPFLVKPAAI